MNAMTRGRVLADLARCLRLYGYVATVTELSPATLPHLRAVNDITGAAAVVRIEGSVFVLDDGSPLARISQLHKTAERVIKVLSPLSAAGLSCRCHPHVPHLSWDCPPRAGYLGDTQPGRKETPR